MKLLHLLSLLLFFTIGIPSTAQTVVKNIPIVTEKNTLLRIEILAHEPGIGEGDYLWVDINETWIEHEHGWYHKNELNLRVPNGVKYEFRFVNWDRKQGHRSYTYTYLTITGGKERVLIKSTEEVPIKFILDGGKHFYPELTNSTK